MNLHQLPKSSSKRAKRVGAGWRSGKGKYSGRGQKGQHARAHVRQLFEGGQLVLQKKLPMLRGKMKNRSIMKPMLVINCDDLEKSTVVKNGTIIDAALLVEARLMKSTEVATHEIKLLGSGTLTKKITVKIKASKNAIEKINKAGGEYLS